MSADYRALKALAREKRRQHGVNTADLNLRVVQRIYRDEGVKIDRWDLSPHIRAVYMVEEDDASVLVNKKLPREPKLFALIHELKHHFCDRPLLEQGQIRCGDYNSNKDIEIGAEVFAAEFIFPENEFASLAEKMGLTNALLTAEDVVRFKREMPATVSYRFLIKRFEYLNLAPRGKFAKVKFQVLEEQLFGLPLYKQQWFRDLRSRRSRNQRVS
jgi:Zn-dependent peptidase ImmA (M78 family)